MLAALSALAVPLLALAKSDDAVSATAKAPSFTRDVAPIIAAKCAGCHQIGGIAPFPLQTPKQIQARAPAIAAVVAANRMPPWPPGPRSPAFVGQQERTLSAKQRATIVAWARRAAILDGPARKPKPQQPLHVAPGESLLELSMPEPYAPRAAAGATDDYRCFLLDPKLGADSAVTSARIVPGRPKIVHHVILFRVLAGQVPEAQRLDDADAGPGWSCFGGTGVSLGGSVGDVQQALGDAGWVSAWAPGWGSDRLPQGTGIPMPAGSRIVMQVHYNLLNGREPDRSSVQLTVAPASADVTPLRTMLLPGPVELACARGERGPLCNRDAALRDLARKYGPAAGFMPTGLLILCGRNAVSPRPSAVSTCDRRVSQRTTIHVAAGHMHLLGASIRLTLNPGTPRERVLLDIPRWDFHWQNAYTLVRPIPAEAGDVIRVTCRHDVTRRKHGLHGIPKTPRYVLWGEGTTDEMCLGVLQVARG